jgi:hypothetical protein
MESIGCRCSTDSNPAIGDRLAADLVRRALGRVVFRVLPFQLFEPLEQFVELKVADFGPRFGIVQPAVPLNLTAQVLDFPANGSRHERMSPV